MRPVFSARRETDDHDSPDVRLSAALRVWGQLLTLESAL